MRGVLCLEDGFHIQGDLVNYTRDTLGEVVFFTGMTGYEEALTDPSYAGQILVFTFPMIGNYGIPRGSGQSQRMAVRGLVARDIWAGSVERQLQSDMAKDGCPAISGLDTRELVLHLRERGVKKGVITTAPESGMGSREVEDLVDKASRLDMSRVVEEVSCQEIHYEGGDEAPLGTCVLMDFGVKAGITSSLTGLGYRVCLVPPATPVEAILAQDPACVLLSNGPGDPEDNVVAIETVRSLLGAVPVFGICLGHQIIAKAAGARITKLKYGHHGANHPVKDLVTGKVFVSSQNHNYAVDESALPAGAVVTHRNLNDGTVEGMEVRGPDGLLAASVQFHPEGAPGPLYRQFWSRLTEGGERGA